MNEIRLKSKSIREEKFEWPTIEINNWDEFERYVVPLTTRYREWIFRGQSDVNYEFTSSLFRLFKDMQKIIVESTGKPKIFDRAAHEREMLRRFKSQAHRYLRDRPSDHDEVEWLAIMQHYGAPTKLLDMTFTPYIAAFFSLESGNMDSAVYAVKHSYFKKDSETKEKKRSSGNSMGSSFYTYEPKLQHERLTAQQGLFLVPSAINKSLDEIISSYKPSEKECVRYVISKKMRVEGLRKLRLMNISASTLFPGLDGFCKSLKYQVIDPVQNLARLG
jgi:hypothetical protein